MHIITRRLPIDWKNAFRYKPDRNGPVHLNINEFLPHKNIYILSDRLLDGFPFPPGYDSARTGRPGPDAVSLSP